MLWTATHEKLMPQRSPRLGGYEVTYLQGALVGEWLFGTPYNYRVVDIAHGSSIDVTLWGRGGLENLNYPVNTVVLSHLPNGVAPRQKWDGLHDLTDDQRLGRFALDLLMPMYEAMVYVRKRTPWGELRAAVKGAKRKRDFPVLFHPQAGYGRYSFRISGCNMESAVYWGKLDALRVELNRDKHGFPGLLNIPFVQYLLDAIPPFTFGVGAFKHFRRMMQGNLIGMLELCQHEFILD